MHDKFYPRSSEEDQTPRSPIPSQLRAILAMSRYVSPSGTFTNTHSLSSFSASPTFTTQQSLQTSFSPTSTVTSAVSLSPSLSFSYVVVYSSGFNQSTGEEDGTGRRGRMAYQHIPEPFTKLPMLAQMQRVFAQVYGPVETAHLGGDVGPEVVAPLLEREVGHRWRVLKWMGGGMCKL